MKSLTVIALLGIIIFSACSDEKNNANSIGSDEIVEQTELADPSKVNANASTIIEVDGMMCVMGCGSEIRKHLYQTKAVKSVDFNFVDGRTTNYATIQFDNKQLSKESIVKLIKGIESSDFNARLSVKQKVKVDEENSNDQDEDALINVETKNFQLPNLSNILRSLFF